MPTARARKVGAETRRRGEHFVRKVYAATLEQLAAGGFDRLTVPDVAARAGVNKTSVYRRWPTKADLVRDALHASMGHSQELPDTGNVRADMIEMARLAAGFVESPLGLGVLRTLLTEGANPEVASLATSMFRQEQAKAVHEIIKRAIARGDLPEGTNTRLLLSTVAGALMHRLLVEHGRLTPSFVDGVIDLVLFGACKR